MQFLYPSFLWALLTLSIPILIHLFYFRRFKKVYFTNVRFLKEIKEETSTRNRLKNLLVLLMRCLALACLVFAFAQPFIADKNVQKSGLTAVGIFIDNSSSMSGELENVPLIDIAKERAHQIVSASSENDQFQILTHDFEGKHQRLVSKQEALSLIDEITVTPIVKPLSRVLQRQKQFLNKDVNKSYIISDFQRSITDFNSTYDSSVMVHLLPVQSVQEKNVSVDSAWFESPVPMVNSINNLVVRLTNHSPQPAERVKLSFEHNGQTKPIGVHDIGPRASITDTIPFSISSPGIQEAIVSIADYPISFDDQLFLSFEAKATVKVLAINESLSNANLTALFKGIEAFQLDNQNLNQIQFQRFKEYDLILLNDLTSLSSGLSNELTQFVKAGGKVLLFPSHNADISSYNAFLSGQNAPTFIRTNRNEKQVSEINTNEFVFSDVYERVNANIKLPKSLLSFDITGSQRSSTHNLLSTRDGSPYVTATASERGFVYLCTAPLNKEYNDLVDHAEIFVPMVYKMALSTGEEQPLFYWIGNKEIIRLKEGNPGSENVYKISGEIEFIPGIRAFENSLLLDLNDQVRNSGFYSLKLEETEVRRLAFNFDRRESDLSIFSPDDLEEAYGELGYTIIQKEAQTMLAGFIDESNNGVVLWRWFLTAALLFLLMEILLIRLIKT